MGYTRGGIQVIDDVAEDIVEQRVHGTYHWERVRTVVGQLAQNGDPTLVSIYVSQ